MVSSKFPVYSPYLQHSDSPVSLKPLWLFSCLHTTAVWTPSWFNIGGLFQTFANILLQANLVSAAFLETSAIV